MNITLGWTSRAVRRLSRSGIEAMLTSNATALAVFPCGEFLTLRSLAPSRLCVRAFACSVLSVFSVVNAFAVPDCGPARLRSLRRAQGRRGSDAAQCADASAVAALARISKLGNWSRSRSLLSRNCSRSAKLRFLTSPLDWFDHWSLRCTHPPLCLICTSARRNR